MYLKKSTNRKTGRTHLSIVHGFRDANGITRTKTVRTLGYLDELRSHIDDPIAHFTQLAAEMDKERLEADVPLTIAVKPREKLEASTVNRKNLGFVALSAIYRELGLNLFFNNRQRTQDFDFRVNSIVRLLLYTRILSHGLGKNAFEAKDDYFEKFDFSLEDIHRCQPFLIDLKDDILDLLDRKITELYGRDRSQVYYDVTNYHFEIDEGDELRRRDVSKELRSDLIVQMVLATDGNGLPISYELYSGNTVESMTLLPALARMRRHFGLGRIVVIADKGHNASNNIAANLAKGDGYIFSQPIAEAPDELREWVVEDDGYSTLHEGLRCKSRIATRELQIEDVNSKKKPLEISERQIAQYSAEDARRTKAQRAELIAKARDLTVNPTHFDRVTSFDAARYLKGVRYDKSTGEILGAARILAFDDEKLAREEALDGYSLIVTSEMAGTDGEIIDRYRRVRGIEESFGLTESDPKARPATGWKPEQIKVHFLICYIALVVARVLEGKTGYRYSIPALSETLRKASGSHIEGNNYLFDHYDEVLGGIGAALGIDFSRKILSLGEIRKLMASSPLS